jgi:hypothetical protein
MVHCELHGAPHPQRQGLSRPQLSRSVQGLYLRPRPPGSPKSDAASRRRRAGVEPVIGHLKDDHRIRKGRDGDRINAVLAAAGCNFSLLLRWFRV